MNNCLFRVQTDVSKAMMESSAMDARSPDHVSYAPQTYRKPVDLRIYPGPTACPGANIFISRLGTSGLEVVSATGQTFQ